MADTRMPDRWLLTAALGVAAITVARLVLLAWNGVALHPTEAQAWLWAQAPAGAPSPLTALAVAAATAPGDAPFLVRLPAPILHAATALILGAIADRLFGARLALAAALAYATLPVVALGSLVLTPETVAAPFLAGAFALYLRLLDGQARGVALAGGAMLGVAILAHPAAALIVLCAAAAGTSFHEARPRPRNALLMAGAMAAVLGAALALRLWGGFGWPSLVPGLMPDPMAPVRFALALILTAGPVFAVSVLGVALAWSRQSPIARFLLIFALPFAGLAALAAPLGTASWAWGAAAWLFALPVALARLSGRLRPWRMAGLALNASIAMLLPLAALAPDRVPFGAGAWLEPPAGRAELSQTVLDIGADLRVRAIVAGDPALLADIAHAGRGGDILVLGLPGAAAPRRYVPGPADVLLILPAELEPPCPEEAMDLAEMDPETGAYRGRPQRLYLIPGACLGP